MKMKKKNDLDIFNGALMKDLRSRTGIKPPKRRKPTCPSCGGKLRLVGGINKPDMDHVILGGSYSSDGLYQCVDCKDVFINPGGF
jgi:hypothetical protein